MADLTKGNEHVTDDHIVAYLDRKMAPGERHALQDHLSECDECRTTALEAARVLGARRRRRQRFAGVGLAAAAAVVAVLIIPPDDDGNGTVVRSGGPEATAVEVIIEWDGGSNTDRTFVWRPIDGALQYRVELVTPRGVALWEMTTIDTAVTVPEEIELPQDADLLWAVDVLMGDGSSVTTGYRPVTAER